MPQSQPKKSKLATWALSLGLGSLVLGPLLGLPAMLIGMVSSAVINHSHGAIKGKPKAIIGLITGFISTLYFTVLIVLYQTGTLTPLLASDNQLSDFEVAEHLIRYKSSDQVAHGNTPEAKRVAEQFSRQMAEMKSYIFEGVDLSPKMFSLTGDNFLSYCQLNEESAIILVHIPTYRKYTPEAQKILDNLAWYNASYSLLEQTDIPIGTPLIVATKGTLRYKCIRQGTLQKQFNIDRLSGIESSTLTRDDLRASFLTLSPAHLGDNEQHTHPKNKNTPENKIEIDNQIIVK